MDTLALAISLLATALGAPRAFFLFRSNLNDEAFCAVVTRLINAGNIDRAIKLCSAATHTIIGGASQAALLQTRERPSEDIDARLDRVADAYTTKRDELLLPLYRQRPLSWAAAALGLAGLSLSLVPYATDIPPSPMFTAALSFGVLGLALAVYATLMFARHTAASGRVGDSLLKSLSDLWVAALA